LLLAVMGPHVDDIALLRQTIRRCTAVLVATLAITGVSLQRPSDAGFLLVIAVGSVLYFVTEFFQLSSVAENPDDDASQPPSADEPSRDL
jgi:hypothetical protein